MQTDSHSTLDARTVPPVNDVKPPRLLQTTGLWLGPVLFFVILLFLDLSPGQPLVTRTAAVAALMATWWICDSLPLAITSLLPVVLFPMMGIMGSRDVATTYVNDIIFLFIGGFLVAIAMERWNLHRRVALGTLSLFGTRPRWVLLGFMVATAFLSMWISNTATAMMMVPIAVAVLAKFEEEPSGGPPGDFGVALLLGIAWAASLGGVATLVGTPPNLVFAAIFRQSFPEAPEISFAGWITFAGPLALVMLLVAWWLLGWVFSIGLYKGGTAATDHVLKEQRRALGAMTWQESVVLVVFVSLAVLWLTRTGFEAGRIRIPGWSALLPHGSFVNDGTVAIAMALVLFIMPARSPRASRILDAGAIRDIPWSIVLLFGGGFALAAGIAGSGLSDWIGERLALLGNLHPLMIIVTVCLVITFLTELTSNTATANVLLPILAANAVALGMDPLLLMIPGTLMCSFAFMLPVATPPNAIVFGTGRLSVPQMARTGIYLNMLGVVIASIGIWTLGRMVFGIELGVLPAWAGP